MIHPDTELKFINKEGGYGVVATKLIPKGTITWALDKLDRVFDYNEYHAFDSVYKAILDKYCYRDCQGRNVFCWDISRYVNHSFNSSCVSTAYDFEIAVRDIYPGQELTDDYGYLNVSEPFECLKEPGSDRTIVYPDDLLNFYPIWDAKTKEAFKFFNEVNQPLFKFLTPENARKAQLVGCKKIEMDSILKCYYNAKNDFPI